MPKTKTAITFRGPVARLNRVSNDDRVLCYGDAMNGLRHAEMPLPLMALTPHGHAHRRTHSGVGLVDTLWVESEEDDIFLMAGGRFGTHPWPWHVAGAVEVGLLKPALDADDADEITVFDGKDRRVLNLMTLWRIRGVTLTSEGSAWDLPPLTLTFPPGYGGV